MKKHKIHLARGAFPLTGGIWYWCGRMTKSGSAHSIDKTTCLSCIKRFKESKRLKSIQIN